MPLLDFLARSASGDEFRVAVEQFVRSGEPNAHVVFDFRCPPVKVERTLTKILEAYPALAIEKITIGAVSGCEFFRGNATIDADDRSFVVRFEWNCRWKAEQLGWTDWFGFADQARAAREFGYDCFCTWDEQAVAATASA